MKATIDIPDELYRRVKAHSAEQGRKIRDVTAELFRQWLGDCDAPGSGGVPRVKPEELQGLQDVTSLRRAYPRGYRLIGPLLTSSTAAPTITPEAVGQALVEMDELELRARQ